MELTSFLHIAQILISATLIVVVLMQVKGTGFGAALGGADQNFRTRRGIRLRNRIAGSLMLGAGLGLALVRRS